jgi:cytochrome c-type biogenesis protein CcmH
MSRRAGWLLLVVVVASLFAVGISRDAAPQTQRERIDAISKRLACPTCDGESVFESRASSSENLRREIARLVGTGEFTDDEVVEAIDAAYTQDLTLTPDGTGLEALAWALPVVVAVVAVAGLSVAFVGWRRENERDATDDDRAIVASALSGEDRA